MKRGDLVRYTPFQSPEERDVAQWIGTILEVHERHVRIFWHDLGEIQNFGIGRASYWEVLS